MRSVLLTLLWGVLAAPSLLWGALRPPLCQVLWQRLPALESHASESDYVRSALTALQTYLDEQPVLKRNHGQKAHYKKFVWSFVDPHDIFSLVDHQKNASADTRVIAHLPGPNETTLWSHLSTAGRLELLSGIAEMYRGGQYQARHWGLGTLVGGLSAYDPIQLLAAASRGEKVGECRLAASAIGAILGELGLSPRELRTVSGEPRPGAHHRWVEVRLEPNGPWYVVDATPRKSDRPAVFPLESASGRKYREAVGRQMVYLLLDPSIRSEERSPPTAVHVTELAETRAALYVNLQNAEPGPVLSALLEETAREYAPRVDVLTLRIPPNLQTADFFARPSLESLRRFTPRTLKLVLAKADADQADGRQSAILGTIGRSEIAGLVKHLEIADTKLDTAAVSDLFRVAPAMNRLSLRRCLGLSSLWPEFLQGLSQSRVARLEFVGLADMVSEDDLRRLFEEWQGGRIRLDTLDLSDLKLPNAARMRLRRAAYGLPGRVLW